MKKIILVIMLLVVGVSGFSIKYQPNPKPLQIFLEENFGEEYVGYVWSEKDEKNNYDFRISQDIKNKKMYLYQLYSDDSQRTGGKILKTPIFGGYITEGMYEIFSHTVKGVYYVRDYVDSSGKAHKKLYFGFDEEQGTIVILDGNMNIIEVLKSTVAS